MLASLAAKGKVIFIPYTNNGSMNIAFDRKPLAKI